LRFCFKDRVTKDTFEFEFKKLNLYETETVMAPSTIKDKLHHYIDTADEKKLLAIYTILEDEIEGEYFYTQDEIKMFYDRRQQHLNGASKSYSVNEAHNLVRQNRKNDL
jgi:hypothetical protein